jgi:DNA modification methylase
LNEENGLPTLETNSIELGYTDPVWNSDMKPNVRKYHNRELDNKKNKVFFDDNLKDFEEFTKNWFNELNRVCKKMILVIPEGAKYWFIRNTDPVGDAPVLWKNGFSGSKIARKSKKSTYLFYGKFEREKRMKVDYIAKKIYTKKLPYILPYTLRWGFCSDQKEFIHPSPKGTEICLSLLKMLKPESMIDCFAGSGSYIYSASILGIRWLGYEKEKKYKVDIDKRFSQKTLDQTLKRYF